MGTYVKNKDVVTKDSGHKAPGAPAISPSPPTPPAGPVPIPYLYVASSSNGKDLSGKLKIMGASTMIKASYIDPIEAPANGPSQPCAILDIVTHAKCMAAHPMDPLGASGVRSNHDPVATTGDNCCLNVLTKDMQLCQSVGPFIGAGAFKQMLTKGTLGKHVTILTIAEPVAVASGDVVDEAVDIADAGLIPVVWKRRYSTAQRLEHSPIGAGGWTHSFDQWVKPEEDVLLIREDEGDTRVPALLPRSFFFHRPTRQTITRGGDASYTVHSLDTGLTREYSPLGPNQDVAMLRAIRDAWGNSVILQYDGGRLSSIVGTAQRELRVAYGANGLVAKVEIWARGKSAGSVKYEYDDAKQLVSAHDLLGHVEHYAYDGNRRMVTKTRKNGVRFYYTYDRETGMCKKAFGDGKLHSYEFDYDLKEGVTVAHGNPQPRRYVWNTHGAITRMETFDGGWVREWIYDEDDYLVSVKSASGPVFVREYDARGNLVKQVDAAGNENLMEYKDDRCVRWTQPGGMVTEYMYDAKGAVLSARDSLGRATHLEYDAHGRLASVYGEGRPSYRYEYDEEHNVVKCTCIYGGAWTQTFDALGMLVSQTDPSGNTTRFEFDRMGQLLSQRDCDGATRRLAWDGLGNQIEEVSHAGRTTRTRFGGTGVAAAVILGDGKTWELSHDVNEELHAVRNPLGETYSFRRDRAARITETTSFDGQVTRYFMAKNERLARVEYEDATYREFSYDALGELVEERTPHGVRRLERDAFGRVTEAVLEEHNGKIVVGFGRGVDRQPESETLNGRTIRYEIDAHRRRVGRTLPNGQVTRFGYDPMGNLALVEHGGQRVSIERDKAGLEVCRRVHRGNVDILTAHDHRRRPVRQAVVSASRGSLFERRFEYDADDRLTALHDTRIGSFLYEHDAAGRLVGARGPGYDERFMYDVNGALVGVVSSAGGEPWAMTKGGKVLRTPLAEYAYDARGRRIRKATLAAWKPTGAVTEYLWDCRDQLREVRLPDGTRVLYTYDAFGRRVRKELIPHTPDLLEMPRVRVVEYVWEQDELAMEIDSERGVRVYVLAHGTHEPILQAVADRVDVFVNDQLRAPLDMIGDDGALTWSCARSPWGKWIGAGDAPTPFRMLGQYHDEETGLAYTRFRYFDPETLAWISPDPIGIAGGANLHAFNGNPTSYADPLGLVPCFGFGNVKYTTANGRITGMNAIVTKEMIQANAAGGALPTGTDATGKMEPAGRNFGEPRGHILANSMGGPGTGPMANYNLIAMTTSGNSGQMSPFEVKVGASAVANSPTNYNVQLNNGGPSAAASGSCVNNWPGQTVTPGSRPDQVNLGASNPVTGAVPGNPGPITN